jgi:hypothetical protein
MRKVLLASGLALIVIFAWCAGKRMFRDDEKRIREVIEEMRLAAEELSADRLIAHFSKDYSDDNGYTKMIIYGLVRRNFQKVDELRVTIEDLDVMVTGDRAWVSLSIVAEASRGGEIYYPFGSDDDPEQPSLTFKKTKAGNWLIIKVDNVRDSGF